MIQKYNDKKYTFKQLSRRQITEHRWGVVSLRSDNVFTLVQQIRINDAGNNIYLMMPGAFVLPGIDEINTMIELLQDAKEAWQHKQAPSPETSLETLQNDPAHTN